jgi:DDE family transposase
VYGCTKKNDMLATVRETISSTSFIDEHRSSPKDFTRVRVLTFRVLVVMMLRKGMKSLQLSLNEFIPKLGLSTLSVTNMAYSKARRKLKHTAFVELNKRAIVQVMYRDDDYRTYKGLRVLAIDGSILMIPDTDEMKEVFGVWRHRFKSQGVSGEHCYGRASVLYDVLNRIAVDAQLAACTIHEVPLAIEHLSNAHDGDLVVYDRNYCSYKMMAQTLMTGSHFLIRCRRKAGFRVADDMLAGNGDSDQTATIPLPTTLASRQDYQGLPSTITVRFVRVVLDDGTVEVVATSLTDQQKYPAVDFKELYWLRWGVETFYGIVKTRLCLENFTGYSPEAIRQDFFATIFLTGVETLLTEDAEAKLARQPGGYPKKVNKAVSFNAIKEGAFELFLSDLPEKQTLDKLTELFQTSPTIVRKDRIVKRRQRSSHNILGFWKRARKGVF